MSKFIITILAFVFHFNTVFADAHIIISNINSETIEFKRAGIIPMGAESLYFNDNLGKQYEMTCGGEKVNLRLFKSSSWSDLIIKGNLPKCREKVFSTLKEQLELGSKLEAIDFDIINKELKNGKQSPLTEFHMEYSFKNQ